MVNPRVQIISPAQVRAARNWLYWTQDELSEKSGVAKRTIAAYESNNTALAQERTLAALKTTFEDAGVEFMFDETFPEGIRIRRALHNRASLSKK